MADRLIKGYWDCDTCGEAHIDGMLRECPKCGKPRGENTTFYMDESNKEYLSEEECNTHGKGADWQCEFCGALNSTLDKTCKSCGSKRDTTNKDYFEMVEERKEKEQKQEEEKEKQEEFEAKYDSTKTVRDSFVGIWNSASSFVMNKWKLILSSLGAFIVILLLIFGAIKFFSPKQVDITVTNHSWEKTIDIESYELCSENDWKLPDGADLLRTEEEIRYYKDVLDHYETKSRQVSHEELDHYETKTRQVPRQEISGYRTEHSYSNNGDGSFTDHSYQVPIYTTVYDTETYQEPVYKTVWETQVYQDPVYRQDPVYETKYYYTIYRWLHKREVRSSGTGLDDYWGTVTYAENEREEDRSESFAVIYQTKKGKTGSYMANKDIWELLQDGQSVTVEVSFDGQINRIVK